MYKTLEASIVGIAPLIMHNGQLSDPLNKYAKAMKEIASKRKKTEADYEMLADIEYKGSLYMDQDGPIIPSQMVEATLLAGARKSKNGKLAQAGIIVEKHAGLQYDGPRTADALLANESFRCCNAVRVGAIKVMRTRPIFLEWSAKIEISYLPGVINERDLFSALRDAGAYAGFGDWRPRHGRFALGTDIQTRLGVAA